MKINSLNLQTYQSINGLKSLRSPNVEQHTQPKQGKKLAGSSFSELLNREEIKFLNDNFNRVENRDKPSSKLLGRKIDIVA